MVLLAVVLSNKGLVPLGFGLGIAALVFIIPISMVVFVNSRIQRRNRGK